MAAINDDNKQRTLRELMVREQLKARGIGDPNVLSAMERVPRHVFIPDESKDQAYEDHPVAIGTEETISQPYIVAYMLEELRLSGQDRVLEIGTGSGYQTALLSELAGEVFTIEINPQLLKSARSALEAAGYANISFRIGDGHMGWHEKAPFDKIILSACASHIPEALVAQLCEGGLMILPMGVLSQSLVLIEKKDGQIRSHERCRVSFIKMKHAQ